MGKTDIVEDWMEKPYRWWRTSFDSANLQCHPGRKTVVMLVRTRMAGGVKHKVGFSSLRLDMLIIENLYWDNPYTQGFFFIQE